MPLGLDELIERWTVLDDERKLIAGKRGPTRLGFAVLLKFFTQHGRFPSGRPELPDEAIGFVARQVKVPASDIGFYEGPGSTGGKPADIQSGVSAEPAGSESLAGADRSMSSLVAAQLASRFRASCEGDAGSAV